LLPLKIRTGAPVLNEVDLTTRIGFYSKVGTPSFERYFKVCEFFDRKLS